MRLVTRQEIIDSAPREWAEQYSGPINYGEDKTIIMHKLQALIPPYTREAIDMAIGNGCWTTNICDECGADCETLVRFGSEPDWEVRWQDLCATCLAEALKLSTSPDAPGTADPARRD